MGQGIQIRNEDSRVRLFDIHILGATMPIVHPSNAALPAYHVVDLGFAITTIEDEFVQEENFVYYFKKGKQLIVAKAKTEER